MNILILGATSSIARACAAEFAARGDTLYLASRDTEELTRIAMDLRVRFSIKVHMGHFDIEDLKSHALFLENVLATLKTLDGVGLACGYLDSVAQSQQMITCNFSGAVSILNYCADYFAQQKHGFIIGLSSVAADRGRQSNYVYGAAKAGLTIYLQGLRHRLLPLGIQVLTVKLGFVDTAMTFGLPGLFLVAQPQTIAKKILQALKHKQHTIYLPWFWRYIMLIIKAIPEKIFKYFRI